jgi:hypothetical protein
MIPSNTTLHVTADEGVWHGPRYHTRADELLAALERAMASRRARKAAKLRAAWLHQVHLDRISYAREIAKERGLRFDPIGRGPIVDCPTVHYRDHLPWYLTPVSRYADKRVPDRAADVLDTWNGSGSVFDGLYIADEPVSSGHFPVHTLIGAISQDGRLADWFILDRWSS